MNALAYIPQGANVHLAIDGSWGIVVADARQADGSDIEAGTMVANVEADCDLFFTDPPYNFGIDYGDETDDRQSKAKFRWWLTHLVESGIHRVRPGGAVWVMLPDEFAGHGFFILENNGLIWRNTVIWHESFGVQTSHKFARCHRQLLYFVKPGAQCKRPRAGANGGGFYFDPSEIKVPSRRQEIGDIRAKPGGKIPGDVWEIPRIAGTHAERCKEVPTQVPEELLTRIVRACCPRGGKVLEACTGSGSMGRVCVREGRIYEGWEISEKFANIAADRIREIEFAKIGGKL